MPLMHILSVSKLQNSLIMNDDCSVADHWPIHRRDPGGMKQFLHDRMLTDSCSCDACVASSRSGGDAGDAATVRADLPSAPQPATSPPLGRDPIGAWRSD